MTTAIGELSKKSKSGLGRGHDPLAHRYPSPATSGVDIDTFMLDIVKSKKLDIDVGASITSGSITRTMGGASTIEVTISDHRRVLLNSDIWDHSIDINLNGHFFRLVQVGKSGDDLSLTFEDRIVAYLRQHTRHIKVSRGKMTRAEFIRMLIKKIKATDIRFYCPELHKKQPIKAVKKNEEERNERLEPGLRKSVKIRLTKNAPVKYETKIVGDTPRTEGPGRGTPRIDTTTSGGHEVGPYATRKQLDTAEKILDTGYQMDVDRKGLVVALMVAIQESKLDPRATSGRYVGVFQQDARYWPATRDPVKDSTAFFKRLKEVDKEFPGASYDELGTRVQNPQAINSSYRQEIGQWKQTAKNIVDEYGAQGGDTQREVRKAYQFTVGPPDGQKDEDYWEAILRLAEEVRWRIFVVGNTVYYVADRDLMQQKPRMTINEDDEGIDSIDFDWDVHKRNNEATVTCQADRWFAPQGSVVVLEKSGPANGRWLVWQIERDLFSPDTTITLKKAQKAKKEPAPEVVSVAREEGDDTVIIGGKVRDLKKMRDRIVAAAFRGLKEHHRLVYRQARPIPRSLWTGNPLYTDCSGFTTLCYKAAGAPDPNGYGYNGSGNTGSQMANGTKVAHPKPGDMVFYRSPEHVGIFIGDGEVIEFGGEPGPLRINVNYRGDLLGFWRFDLSPESTPDRRLTSSPIKAPTGKHAPYARP